MRRIIILGFALSLLSLVIFVFPNQVRGISCDSNEEECWNDDADGGDGRWECCCIRDCNDDGSGVSGTPIGWHDVSLGGVDCVVAGWTCDASDYSKPLDIHVYVDDKDGKGNQFVGAGKANGGREDAVKQACGNVTNNHGYNYTVPDDWRDGQSHNYYVYAIGIEGDGTLNGENPLLLGSPKAMTCSVAPTSTPTPTPTTPAGGPSPSPTPTISGPTITPPPPPPPGSAEYTIEIGTKQSLTIQIGAGTTSQVRFKAKLAHTQNNPDMYFKLRVVDELAFLDNPSGSSASCDAPPAGGKDFWVPVQADGNGIYSPVSQTNAPAPQGGTVASVSSDGWVALDGLSSGKYYSFLLKSPKSRGTKMAEHVQLQPSQSQAQDFDWTGNPLFPGDLPDPNNSNKQDCTVNSIDLSLVQSRLGTTDQVNLDVGDVNYDGVINGNDISKVVNTLSTKPDDDI